MSIPVNQDKRIFQFKTAPLHDGEGHSSLECVHQGVNSLNPRSQDQVSRWLGFHFDCVDCNCS